MGGTRGGALTIKRRLFYCESTTRGPTHMWSGFIGNQGVQLEKLQWFKGVQLEKLQWFERGATFHHFHSHIYIYIYI